MTFDPTEDITDAEVLRMLRCIVAEGTVYISSHAKVSMQKRGYSVHDVEYILCNGSVGTREFKEEYGNWSYVIRGDDLEGDDGGVVVAIITHAGCLIITVLS